MQNGIMLALEAPYNKEFMASLKASLPKKKRIWDDADKCWYIVKDQFDRLCHMLDEYYDQTILLDFPAQEVAGDHYAILHLLPGAPLEVVRASYKALSKIHHPDHGGDGEVMTRVNVAYKAIMGEIKNGD